MRFLALERELPAAKQRKMGADLLREEAASVWSLQKREIVREIWFGRNRCAVVMLECRDETEARAHLATLPLVHDGFIAFDLSPLSTYDGFDRLLTPAAPSPAEIPSLVMSTENRPQTLREIAGLPSNSPPLADSVVIVVDAQKEYTQGRLPLPRIAPALQQLAQLLARARALGTPVIHVVQHGRPGGPICDPNGPHVAILDEVRPLPGETIAVKALPSSFKGTTLDAELKKIGRKHLIVGGFMTHMCVNSTVRDATETGYTCTVVAAACATRDLPDGSGGLIPAETVHAANLAALRDRFAIVINTVDDLP